RCDAPPFTMATPAHSTRDGRLVKNGSTRPRRGASSHTASTAKTASVATSVRLATLSTVGSVPQVGANAAAVLHEEGQAHHLDPPRPRQIDLDAIDDSAGAWAHHHHL